MQREDTYWSGVRSRLLPASAVGLVAAVVVLWLDGSAEAGAALLVGLATLVATALIPSRRPPRADAGPDQPS